MDCACWNHEVSLYARQFVAVQHTVSSSYLQADYQAGTAHSCTVPSHPTQHRAVGLTPGLLLIPPA